MRLLYIILNTQTFTLANVSHACKIMSYDELLNRESLTFMFFTAMLITYIKGGTPVQIVFGEGVCNDKGYICYFLTEVIKFYWLMLLFSGQGLSIQHYVIKFVSDLRLVDGFLRGTMNPFTNKTDRYDITEILLTVMLNTITLNPNSTIHKIFKYIDQSKTKALSVCSVQI
jgi:hypothetical protein